MCVRVTAQRWLINFARSFAFNFLSALPLRRFHRISVFLYFSYIAQLFCIFFLWYSSKFNDFASALGLVNQIVAEYCLLFSQAISTVVLFNCLLPARRFKCVSEMVWLASLR